MAENINGVRADEEVKRYKKMSVVKRLFSYLKPYKMKVFIVVLLMIVIMVSTLINPMLLEVAIDKCIGNNDVTGLIYMAIAMVTMNLVAMFAMKGRIKLMSSITNNILINIREDLYTHIQKLSFGFFDSRPVGKILARVIGDIDSLKELFDTSIMNLIPEMLTLVCVAVMMFVMNYKLAFCALVIIPLLFLGIFTIEKIGTEKWRKFRQKKSNLNGFIHEDFSGIKLVQAFAAENSRKKSFKDMNGDMIKSFISCVRISDLFWPLVSTSSGLGTILVYIFGAKFIQGGELEVGTLISFTWYVTMFWRPIIKLSDFYNSLITNIAGGERIFEILDMEPEIFAGDHCKEMPTIDGRVEFKNVGFAYDKDTTVLNDISFNVEKGSSIALVGATGAGKTTIINLISRFYDVNSGAVLIDGIDVRNVTLESLRSQMGIMLQDTFLFSASIKENIRYGKLDASDEEIIEAAKAVNAHDFIMKLPKGYDTEINERGSRLSVGQRQLISFARALLANPRILILDEATSNIDTATEILVQRGIQKLLKGRTSFVIAHRLSTIRDCDRIMVINGGSIEESGTHEELLAKKGYYYDLYMAQYRFLKEGA
ncbi:ATP-binding cassette, subfamily B [Hathewaya proteolytica DSM 3090]|uniref:ATP-binding cassette, subfamily B n=2 Tax=Hathewaya proteolytica TaxID=29365 RepID=A0A1M6R9Q8_9CLOT|nr:ATP-binding cassette, subfamily B [Hathewaya proteolytica DSM 3090]